MRPPNFITNNIHIVYTSRYIFLTIFAHANIHTISVLSLSKVKVLFCVVFIPRVLAHTLLFPKKTTAFVTKVLSNRVKRSNLSVLPFMFPCVYHHHLQTITSAPIFVTTQTL
ncbi:unnamed protein product [Vicia faba]|uniref:Uncharacterized protein n=1 Tax=Vicia faba TaxID=3906 RepID=A0AAV1A8Q0_VICFA|nr:unnamed protein product [Vicia faba]